MTALLDLAELLVQAYAECARDGATVEPVGEDPAIPREDRAAIRGERPWAI